jgi:hypothetical protein
VEAAAEKVMALATNAQSVAISLFITYPPLKLGYTNYVRNQKLGGIHEMLDEFTNVVHEAARIL